eukprot:Nk52_evm16s1737 gene=Nk52_evmTU16s1737
MKELEEIAYERLCLYADAHFSGDMLEAVGSLDFHLHTFLGSDSAGIEVESLIRRRVFNEAVDIDSCDKMGYTVLHKACQLGKSNIVEEILERGGSLAKKTKFHNAPLHLAAVSGSIQCCRLLLEKGADVDAISQQGYTAAHYAATHGHQGVLLLLIESGCRIKFKDSVRSLLVWAMSFGWADALKALLQRGGNVEEGMFGGNLLFSVRADKERVECLRIVFDYGINPLRRNKFGETPLEYAVEAGLSSQWIHTLKKYIIEEYPPSLKRLCRHYVKKAVVSHDAAHAYSSNGDVKAAVQASLPGELLEYLGCV